MSTPRRVLVLEDGVLLAMHLETVLAENGHEPVPAASIAAAELCLAQGPVDIALLDLMLPDGTSLDLAQALRAAGTAVAILSGADDDQIPAGFEFARHFRKPVHPEKLMTWINSLT